MAKLAILLLAAVAFQAAFAGVPRYFAQDTTDLDLLPVTHNVSPVHFKLMCQKLIAFCKTTDMSEHMIIECMHKFMHILDFCLEKLCVSGKCHNVVMGEICMELKNCKMMLERCLSHVMSGDFHHMKMECCECIRLFCDCIERFMMCDDCCFDMHLICNEICMRFVNFCEFFCGKHHFMGGELSGLKYTRNSDLVFRFKLMCKKFITFCETTDMTKDMLVDCIHKFMVVLDFCIEKLCVGGKCHNVVMGEICMEFKNCKMMLERCLSHVMSGDFHHMKMECCECIRLFCDCIERFMMCDDCCFDMHLICNEICMCFFNFCEMFWSHGNVHFSTQLHLPHFYHKDFPSHIHTLLNRFVRLCESDEVSKDVMITFLHKFMTIIDFTLEKMCFGNKCDTEICMQLRNCKIMLERCLSYGFFTDVYRFRMECCECIKTFFRCCEMMLTCDNCCVGFEMIWRDICMRFESMCNFLVRENEGVFGMMGNFVHKHRNWYTSTPYFFLNRYFNL